MIISVLLMVVFKFSFSQKAESSKVLCQKTVAHKSSYTKKPTVKKISRIDSLLIEREFRVEEDETTKDVDIELSKMSYAPKVVLQKHKEVFKFNYFQFINDLELNSFKEKLVNDFKITTITIDNTQMSCQVGFASEANENDKNEFFKAFGYDGIIYR